MSSLAEENLNEINKLVSQFTPIQELCESLSPNDALNSTCSCYLQALSTTRLKLVEWGEYYKRMAARDQYLSDMADWDRRWKNERTRLENLREHAACRGCGTTQKCKNKSPKNNWYQVGTDRCQC